jgi:hypothetical protein
VSEEEEEEEPPNIPQDGFIYLLANLEPHGLPPRSSYNHSSPLKKLWVNKI